MNTLGSLKDTKQDLQRPIFEPQRHSQGSLTIAICLVIAGILVFSYFIFFRQTTPNLTSQDQPQKDAPQALSTEAQVFEDEPILKDSQAVISGTVRNISREPLNDLSLELELKKRTDGNTELRTVTVEPNDLAPGEEGKYSLIIPRQEFSGTQIKRLKSAERSTAIVFKTAPGARRPKELPPEPPTKTVIIQRPTPRQKGDEFINTPDNPTKVH